MIYEIRIYEAAPGKLADLHARFRNHTIALFEKHGMKIIGFFTSDIGEWTDRLTYILGFDNLEHRERAWTAFREDPEWAKAKAESEKNGPLVRRLKSTILTPTSYSPMK